MSRMSFKIREDTSRYYKCPNCGSEEFTGEEPVSVYSDEIACSGCGTISTGIDNLHPGSESNEDLELDDVVYDCEVPL